MPSHFSLLRRWILPFVVATASPLAMAQTDPFAAVDQLVRAGQLSQALAKANQYLADKPRDAQMRFLKGVIQTESGKPQDAVATFVKLTEDFPELPEPYNNLAVLYASQSQFDKARAALEIAIRTNPSYATAHENLGDVYAKLAGQAYSKALQLDAGNTGVPPKLNLIRSLFAVDGKVSSSGAEAAPAGSTDDAKDVELAVSTWAKAWSSKDLPSYLGAYANNFTPTGGQARKAWEAKQRSLIEPRSSIQVDISAMDVKITGERATARFRQDYSSDNLDVSSRKVLDLVKSGNRWLIVRESTGS